MTARRVAATAAVLVSTVLIAWFVPAPVSADQPASMAGPLSTLGSCVAQQHRLDVLMVLDTSKSLGTTDSADQRQGAAQLADGGLAQLAAGSAASPSAERVRVDVAVARFDSTFSIGAWHDVASDNAAVQTDIDADTPKRPQGDATDYVLALGDAQQAMATRAAATDGAGQPACQALIWFTDGGYEPQGQAATDQEWADGTDALCGPGKIVDQLRTAGTTVVTVALTTEIPDRGIDMLKKITADPTQPPAQPCGSAPPVPGKFLPVDRTSDLVDAFIQLAKLTPPETLCQSDQCTFTLEPELRSFFVLIHTAADSDQLWLWPPDNQPYQTTGGGGSVTVAGAQLQLVRVNPTTFTVTGTLPPDTAAQWQGTWRVTLANGAGRPVGGEVYLFGDLAEQFIGTPAFRRGQPWRFDVLTTAAGAQPVTRLAPLHPSVAVTITDGTDTRSATVEPDGTRAGLDHVTFQAPANWHSASVQVTVKLTVHTGAGVDISPPAQTMSVKVVTPLALSQDQLRIRLNDRDPAVAVLTVAAGDQGGCVWWEPRATRWTPAPTTVDVSVDRSAARDCLRVAPHGHADLQVRLTAAHGWTGTIKGRLVLAQSVAGGPPLEVDLPVTVRLSAHPDPATEFKVWSILFGLTFAPVLLAMILTQLVVRRFHRPRSLRTVLVRATVRVAGTSLVELRPIDGADDWPTRDHLDWPKPVPQRRLQCGAVTFRAVSRWWNPFDTPRTRVVAARGYDLATDSAGPTTELRRLPLNLAGAVVLAAPRDRLPDKDFEVDVVAVVDIPKLDKRTANDIRRAAQHAARRLIPAPDPADRSAVVAD